MELGPLDILALFIGWAVIMVCAVLIVFAAASAIYVKLSMRKQRADRERYKRDTKRIVDDMLRAGWRR